MSRTSFEMMNDGEGRKLISSMDVDVYDHFDEVFKTRTMHGRFLTVSLYNFVSSTFLHI
jgi:hypothetical protein